MTAVLWEDLRDALLASAAAGTPDTAVRLRELAKAEDPGRRRLLVQHVLAALTNGEHYALARQVAGDEGLWADTAAIREPGSDAELGPHTADLVFCLAVVDVQVGGDAERALAGFSRLAEALPEGHPLKQAAEDGESVALNRLGRAVRIDWGAADAHAASASRACPTCGAVGAKDVVLRAVARFPGRRLDTRLLRCPDCTCVFLEDHPRLAYQDQGDREDAALAFYLHHNAGVWPIIRPIARLDRPPGQRYLDIGCGFGFGLDFAIKRRGWIGRGLDPSPHARLGAAALGLPIEPRYFEPADAVEKTDIIAAYEVLEHVDDPSAFMSLLRSGVADDGVLLLSTPNGGSVRQDVGPDVLTPVLSLGAHLVLQTAASLERLLRASGFAHVHIEENPISLIAYASSAPIELVEDEALLRAAYRGYLEWRSAAAGRGTDLWLGLAGRLYQEAVIDGDYPAADAIMPEIEDVLRLRYGIALAEPGGFAEPAESISPEAWARIAPFNLPTLLYHRVARGIAAGETSSAMEEMAAAASRAANTVRRAMATINADDPSLAHVERDGATLAANIAAGRGSTNVAERLRMSLRSVGAQQLSMEQRVAVPRAVVTLIRAGELRQAWQVQREFGAAAGPAAWTEALRRKLASWR